MVVGDTKIEKCQHVAQSIAKLLQCSICLEGLSDPVSIGCGHFFCRNCIGVVLRTQSEVPCPICKKSFTRRHLQEAPQRTKIITVANELVSTIEKIAKNKGSGKKQSKQDASHTPTILLSSHPTNLPSAKNVKKVKGVASQDSKLVDTPNRVKQGMVSYYIRNEKTINKSVEAQGKKDTMKFETKFFDKSQPDSDDFADFISVCPDGKEPLQEDGSKKHFPTGDFASTSNCSVQIEICIPEDGKKTVCEENEVEPKKDDPYMFMPSIEDEESICDKGETKKSCKKKAKGSKQNPARLILKRCVQSPLRSRKKRKVAQNKTELSTNKNVTAATKNQKQDDLSSDALNNDTNCSTKKESPSMFNISEIPVKCVDGTETKMNKGLESTCEPKLGGSGEKGNNRGVKENPGSSVFIENEKTLHSLLNDKENRSLNLDIDMGDCIENAESISCLLSKTASLNVCQKLINNKKSLLKRRHIDQENIAKDTSARITEFCSKESINMEGIVLQVPDLKPEGNDGNFICPSFGWSRIKQMNKDFHLEKRSLLQVQESKNLHLPSVPVCKSSDEVLSHKKRHSSEGSHLPEDAGHGGETYISPGQGKTDTIHENEKLHSEISLPRKGASEAENLTSKGISPLQNKTENASETEKMHSEALVAENVKSDFRHEEQLSDATPHIGKALKKLSFDHSDATNVNEWSMDNGNTAPFDLNDDMDVDDAVFGNSIKPTLQNKVDEEPKLPSVPSCASIMLPEAPKFEFTPIRAFSYSSGKENVPAFEPRVQHKKVFGMISSKPVFSGLCNQNAEVLFSPESFQKNSSSLLKATFSGNESSGTETPGKDISELVNSKQRHPVRSSLDNGRKRSSSIYSIGGEHKVNSLLTEKSFETSRSEKVVKRVCLTLDEICAYFNDSNTSGMTENVCTVPLPFSNYKLQLTVADETLNISILKALQNSMCENLNSSNNSSVFDSKAEPLNATTKEFKDAETQFETETSDAQTQFEVQCVDEETQCSNPLVCSAVDGKGNSIANHSMESLPETQVWEGTPKEEDDCQDWLSESIISETNIEPVLHFEQPLNNSTVYEIKSDKDENLELARCLSGDQVEIANIVKITNDTHISSSLIPSFPSVGSKSFEHKSPEQIDIQGENNSNLPLTKKSNSVFVNDKEFVPDNDSEDKEFVPDDDAEVTVAPRCSTPVQGVRVTETGSEVNGAKMNCSISERIIIKENMKPSFDFTSAEIFEPTKFSNSKNSYSKASAQRKLQVELLMKAKMAMSKVSEKTSPVKKLSPVELELSEEFDPFSDPAGFGRNSAVDPAGAEFDEILKESESYSSDPDMIFATNLVAPLKNIAKKEEEEFSLMVKPKDKSLKNVFGPKIPSEMLNDGSKTSQNTRQFKRISAFDDSDSSGSETLPNNITSRLKRRKRAKEKSFIRDTIKKLEDEVAFDEDKEPCSTLDNPQALARVYANIDADLHCMQNSTRLPDELSTKDICDVKCVFEAPLSCDDPSESASKLELELNEMKEEAEKLRKQIFQEENMEKLNENCSFDNEETEKPGTDSDDDMPCENKGRNGRSVSKEDNEVLSEQIPPTPPNVVKAEKRTKFASKIYNRN